MPSHSPSVDTAKNYYRPFQANWSALRLSQSSKSRRIGFRRKALLAMRRVGRHLVLTTRYLKASGGTAMIDIMFPKRPPYSPGERVLNQALCAEMKPHIPHSTVPKYACYNHVKLARSDAIALL
jgi:hypothetical protein